MKRIVALSFSLMTSTIMSAQASHDYITNVQFDGRDCPQTNGVYKTDEFDFRVKIESRDDEKATLGFYYSPYIESRKESKLVLEAPLVVDPLTFTPQGEEQAYKPAMTLSSYIDKLNRLQIPGFRRFIWNKNLSETLTKDKTGPAVIFELRSTLRFSPTEPVHDINAHTTKVFIEYGLEADNVRSKLLVYEFIHEPVRTPVQEYLWINSQKAIKGLVSVVYNTLPDAQRRTWGEANTFNPCQTYAELHESYVPEVLLNRDTVVVPQGGIYFKKEKGTPLESHFVRVEGGKPYMTRLRNVNAQGFQAENRGAEGYAFTLLEGQNPELHILGPTNYPLLLESKAYIAPLFEDGYYRCDSMNWEGNTVNQTFGEFPHPRTVVYKSRQQSAFSETDLTQRLLDPNTDIKDLTECLVHLNMAPNGVLKPNVIIRLAGRDRSEILKASDRLMQLIEACIASQDSIDSTAFGQVVLNDPTLQKYLLPHISSFPKMHVDADTLHFDKQVVSNQLVDWLWTSRFKFSTLKNVNAEKVEISCLGDNNEILTKLSELRSMKPKQFNLSFERLKPEDRENLAGLISGNPNLTNLILAGSADQLDAAVLKAIADHPKIQTFTLAPNNNPDLYQGFTEKQINDFFVKTRYNVPVSVDLSSPIFSQVKHETIVQLLTNNKNQVTELKLGDAFNTHIAEAIAKLTGLTKLDARSHHLNYNDLSLLSKTLRGIKSLTQVAISLPKWDYFWGYSEVHNNLANIPHLQNLTLKCADWPTWNKEQIESIAKSNKKQLTISIE